MEEEVLENKTTADSILGFLQEKVENKNKLNSEIWLDAAQKLVLLLGDEESALYDLQQLVAQKKMKFLNEQDNKNVSMAKLKIEAEDIYKDYMKQKGKCKRIEEFIRVAKLRAKIAEGL